MESKKKVLIVEDDVFTSRLIKKHFEEQGFVVHQSFDLGSAFFKSSGQQFDIAIVDVHLPSGSILTVMDKLKALLSCPIIVCTSDTTEHVELKSLALDVDEYVVKSRGLEVLLQRAIRLMKAPEGNLIQLESSIEDEMCITRGRFKLDFSLNIIFWGEGAIKLSNNEAKIVHYLMLSVNKVVSKDELYSILYGFDYDGASRSLDLLISRLRKKLNKANIPFKITTLSGRGYTFKSGV